MELEPMTLDELLEMLKGGHVGNINDYYMDMFIRYLEELKTYRKAMELLREYSNFERTCDNAIMPYDEMNYCLEKAREN